MSLAILVNKLLYSVLKLCGLHKSGRYYRTFEITCVICLFIYVFVPIQFFCCRDTSDQSKQLLEEKDETIKELMAEGEKLSKQQLQNSNIIKKLRVKEKENESLLKSQKYVFCFLSVRMSYFTKASVMLSVHVYCVARVFLHCPLFVWAEQSCVCSVLQGQGLSGIQMMQTWKICCLHVI